MTDTQWPRWVVLHQGTERDPHRYAGSVHAPDAEIALQNARDVFVRRPECVSLWVVRADHVLARTAEELALTPSPSLPIEGGSGAAEPYYVFQKIGQKGVHQHVGEVEAAAAGEAMQRALAAFEHRSVLVWWVFPARAVAKSGPEDVDVYRIAETKRFRDQGEYHTVATLRKLRVRQEPGDEG